MIYRMIGIGLIGLALVMASADAVMALGPADYAGIVTADLLVLLLGDPLAADGGGTLMHRLEHLLLTLPAWTIFLMLGVTALVAGRRKPRRYFRKA